MRALDINEMNEVAGGCGCGLLGGLIGGLDCLIGDIFGGCDNTPRNNTNTCNQSKPSCNQPAPQPVCQPTPAPCAPVRHGCH